MDTVLVAVIAAVVIAILARHAYRLKRRIMLLRFDLGTRRAVCADEIAAMNKYLETFSSEKRLQLRTTLPTWLVDQLEAINPNEQSSDPYSMGTKLVTDALRACTAEHATLDRVIKRIGYTS